jgi:hypothetical protein
MNATTTVLESSRVVMLSHPKEMAKGIEDVAAANEIAGGKVAAFLVKCALL